MKLKKSLLTGIAALLVLPASVPAYAEFLTPDTANDKVLAAVTDKTMPTLYGIVNKTIQINTSFDPKAGVSARDNVDGDLTSNIVITGTFDVKKVGTYKLTYTVKDKSGNTRVSVRTITVIDTIKPVIKLSVPKTVKFTYGSTFDPKAGVTATDNGDGDLTKKITVTGTVNTKKVGVYNLVYSVKDSAGNVANEITRTITVADGVAPVLTGVTDKTLNLNANFDPKAGVRAIDNVDGDLSSKVTVTGSVNTAKPGVYTLTYLAVDAAGNKTSLTRKITVVDNVKPVIHNAYSVRSWMIGTPFNPKAGVTATDNVNGDLTKNIVVTGSYDVNKKGVYFLTYSVTDSAGNTTSCVRTLTVITQPYYLK